jgi:hypothetical protein
MAWPRRKLTKAQVPQLAAQRLLGDRDPKLFEDPLRQIDEAPTHDAMDGWDRPILHGLPQRLALAIVENAGGARCLAVQKTIRTVGVKPDNPVAHDLQSDAAGPRRVRARAAVINTGQRQKTPGLTGIARLPRQEPQSRTIKIIPQQNRSRHGKPPGVCHVESDRSPNESRIQRLGITRHFRCGAPSSLSFRVLKRTTAPGARLRALIRLRPVPVNT